METLDTEAQRQPILHFEALHSDFWSIYRDPMGSTFLNYLITSEVMLIFSPFLFPELTF